MDGITVNAAYTIKVSGQLSDMESMARLICSTVKDVQVMLIKYSNGWRLMLICKDETSLNACYSLIQDRVRLGVTLTIVNGKQPLPTRIYSPS